MAFLCAGVSGERARYAMRLSSCSSEGLHGAALARSGSVPRTIFRTRRTGGCNVTTIDVQGNFVMRNSSGSKRVRNKHTVDSSTFSTYPVFTGVQLEFVQAILPATPCDPSSSPSSCPASAFHSRFNTTRSFNKCD
jgi:hypothetical protein